MRRAEYDRPDLSTVSGYVRRLADQLHLRDWEFSIEADESSDDVYATVLAMEGLRASIRVARSFWDELTLFEQREVLVHELCHCHLWLMCVDQLLPRLEIGNAAETAITQTLSTGEEHAVTMFARLLSPGLPMPPWGSSANRVPGLQELESPEPARARRRPRKTK